MNNFEYYSPTRILFGKDMELSIGKEVKRYTNKILLHTGGNSVKKSGLYDRIISSLKTEGIEVFELPGVKPNPRLSLVYEGISICKKEKIDFILAVGGGSVIDSSKAIAVGARYEGDVWDFYNHKETPKEALKVATVLTIPAAGSESSPNSVITNEETKTKLGLNTPLSRPVFSILNPKLCMTLPQNQMANGVCDMLCHVMERYFTNTLNVELTDRLCEATMKTIINNARKLLLNYNDYNAWAEIMWSGTLAHNGLLGTGREEDWASHRIGHPLSANYDMAHGTSLAIIYPAWMKYVYRHNINMFVQFAVKVFDVDASFRDPESIALEGISRLNGFFSQIGLPSRLSELEMDSSKFEDMARSATAFGVLGGITKLNAHDVEAIYRLAL
ncbi:MAG: iron-containing alcohol dehydrogenase [Bacillota bacterium]|nr:iron-containing alcohol dehydrogenase [Bacillota bacterium]